MTLSLYFRLVIAAIFQPSTRLNYANTFFYCPQLYAIDGFSVSLQINHGNYCSSENGYRVLGITWDMVEFGFTSEHEPMMDEFSETNGDTTSTVGRIPLTVMEQVFEKHGGIDWAKSLSTEYITKFMSLN